MKKINTIVSRRLAALAVAMSAAVFSVGPCSDMGGLGGLGGLGGGYGDPYSGYRNYYSCLAEGGSPYACSNITQWERQQNDRDYIAYLEWRYGGRP